MNILDPKLKAYTINSRILSGTFNAEELETIVEAINQEKMRQSYVRSLSVGDTVTYRTKYDKLETGKIIEISKHRGQSYFVTEVQSKVRKVKHGTLFCDVILSDSI